MLKAEADVENKLIGLCLEKVAVMRMRLDFGQPEMSQFCQTQKIIHFMPCACCVAFLNDSPDARLGNLVRSGFLIFDILTCRTLIL
jgi:cytidine deaminase